MSISSTKQTFFQSLEYTKKALPNKNDRWITIALKTAILIASLGLSLVIALAIDLTTKFFSFFEPTKKNEGPIHPTKKNEVQDYAKELQRGVSDGLFYSFKLPKQVIESNESKYAKWGYTAGVIAGSTILFSSIGHYLSGKTAALVGLTSGLAGVFFNPLSSYLITILDK